MQHRVIISDHLHPYLAEQLAALGFSVDIVPDITNEELLKIIRDYHGLVVNTKILVHKELIDAGKELKFVARAGSGMDTIEVAYAMSKGIAVISAPEGNANSVAEHTLGLLLNLTKKIAASDREIRNGIWQREENRGTELEGKTIGIIGYGYTGSAFAKKLSGLEMRILVFDKYKKDFGNDIIEEKTLEELKAEADIFSFHIPYNQETHYYFNQDFISSCAKNFWLLNTSRGKVVDTKSLVDGLMTGKVRGAGLDVFENEKFNALSASEKKLMNDLSVMKNVIMTPHVAGWSYESFFKISKILADRIAALGLRNVK